MAAHTHGTSDSDSPRPGSGASPPCLEIERVDRGDRRGPLVVEIHLRGTLGLHNAGWMWRRVRELMRRGAPPAGGIIFDLAGLDAIDGASAALLERLPDEAAALGLEGELRGAPPNVQVMLDLYTSAALSGPSLTGRRNPLLGLLDQIGANSLQLAALTRRVLSYLGELTLATGRALRAPRTVHWQDLAPLMERAGADGLPILVLINFLVGLVMGFQAAVQLKQFGANIFVADLVGLTVTREIGPLMTALVVTGRSGAAYAAELGTMKVSEEIDALRTLGLCPYRFLVLPRALSLVLVVPFMTLVADLVGLFGGLMVGIAGLDLTFAAYLRETQERLDLWDVFGGVFKSVFFGLAIALIACERGLSASRGAEGVGRATTSAVVATLFTLVILDAAFTVLFHFLGV